MEIILFVALIFIKCSKVAGIWMSTMLPLPRDLELLIDSIYDDGYSPEYLVKYDDISDDDLAQSDLLLGWERPLGRSSVENPVMGILDPDRDGARSLPAWMNYSKAVFVPNEIDDKIRARHRFHPQNGRMTGNLQKEVELYHPEGINDANREANRGNEVSTSTKSNRAATSENLNFLLPIPDFGTTTKSSNVKDNKTKSTNVILPQSLKNSFFNGYIIPQIPDIPVVTKHPELHLAQEPVHHKTPSLLELVDRFRKQFKQAKTENLTNNHEANEISTLEKLYTTLINMKNIDDKNFQSKKSEEEKTAFTNGR
uniref:Uncharacterized protein n=1 Tax=Rhodnius prolixus TaxID=13249 RepID=T1ICE4_RHOPR